MKGKIGLLMVVLCVISFFIYNMDGSKKVKTDVEKIIEGKVVSLEDETPIEGVTISFQGENYKSRTNGLGEFAIFTKGDQELVFRHNNYRTEVVLAKDSKLVKMKASDPQGSETTGDN